MKRIALIASLGMAFCLSTACTTTLPSVIPWLTNSPPDVAMNIPPEVASNAPPVVVVTSSNVPPVVVVPVETNAPAGIVDDVDISSIQIISGPDPRKAKITRDITAKINGCSVTYSGDLPDWPRYVPGNNLAGPYTCLCYEYNGGLVGFYFDWGHMRNPDSKNWCENTMNNSKGKGIAVGRYPTSGTKMYFWQMSRDGKERSQVSFAGLAP